MGSSGDDSTLIKVAVFGIAMSIMATCMVAWFIPKSPDYDYDTINAYREELVDFSGGKLINDNPWVLTAVYTPFIPADVQESDIPNHIEYDSGRGGWLYGQQITDYPDLNKSADIHLDPTQFSNQMLTAGNPLDWEYENGKEWWAGGNEWGIDLSNVGRWFLTIFNEFPGDSYGTIYETGSAGTWNYTGYRYVFDPVLPFKDEASSKDGRLSIVYYAVPGDTGLSGALEVYGTKGNDTIRYGSFSIWDIVAAFQSSAGYVQTFDFDFEGTSLNLTIRFSPTVYQNYNSLIDAWYAGAWSMSISSLSAGNFFDVEDSAAFADTAGGVFDTFIQIYTFETPYFEKDPWINTIIWLLVGLPMTIALLCVTMRAIGGVTRIFGL